MAFFLLSLLHRTISKREKNDYVNLYLKANEEHNKAAFDWYKNRGFKPMKKSDGMKVPSDLTTAFQKIIEDETLTNYFKEEEGLQWLSTTFTSHSFKKKATTLATTNCSLPILCRNVVQMCMLAFQETFFLPKATTAVQIKTKFQHHC